jgi:hypothetical protein
MAIGNGRRLRDHDEEEEEEEAKWSIMLERDT